MGTVTATAQPKYQAPFLPLVPGFKYAPLNDLKKLDDMISDSTCAIMIEPIQGESGIQLASSEFLAGMRALCDEADVLLILDEIQCGMGRTGTFLASQNMGVLGDIVTMAKGIADGFPMGACLARGSAASTLVPGDHGSTFAGQPLACAASLATLDVLIDEQLMQNAKCVGDYFRGALRELQKQLPNSISQIRGAGLMIGVELVQPIAKAVHARLIENGIVVNAVGDHILRLLPPLTVTTGDCDVVTEAIKVALAKD
jgi:acetylornithine/succinyldiaminopimelate/putrescine aminotransferase